MNTILIVEDDKNLMVTLSNILQEEGYEVISTMWGSMALEEVKRGRPDLVLLDIMLPGMNGMQVLERVRKIDKFLPVIMITGYGSAEGAVRAIELGAYDYINKPFEYNKLMSKIEIALKKNKGRKQDIFTKIARKISIGIQDSRESLIGSIK
jgi:two-component system, NtrC family, nitrogen regulation response regulator NtrX